ncbi:MAG: TonB-dependent receptor [Sphingomicrobium sp.]
MRFYTWGPAVAALIPAAAMAGSAQGQSLPPAPVSTNPTASSTDNATAGIKEIVVTARRRAERLQDVPVAVTAISGAQLQERNITNVEALNFVAPALHVSPTAFGAAVPGYTIRAQRSLENLITQDPAVGVYFAEQVQQRPHGTNASLYDLASVEVLKGPQGTLFGRNTTGGAILINPARPIFDTEGSMTVQVGDYGLGSVTAVLNVPLGQTLAIRAAGRITRRNGYVQNLTTGHDTDDERTDSARLSLLWKPSAQLSSYFVGNYFHENDEGGGFIITQLRPGSASDNTPGVRAAFLRQRARDIHVIENSQQPFARIKSWSVSNTTTLALGDVTLKNIAGYRKVDSDVGFDFDGTPSTLFESRNRLVATQWTEELQASGRGLGDKLNYIAGLYYFREHGRDVQNSVLFGSRRNDGEGTNTSYSAYAQLGYKLAPRLNLTIGGRYTIDKRELIARNLLNGICRLTDSSGVPLNPCFKQFSHYFRSPSWLASLDYKVADNTLLYVSHHRGYRSGGWNLRANKPAEQVPFEPETVYDVEGGVKSDLFDHHLRINAAAYRQWYSGIQRTLSFGVPLATVVLNAGRATIQGGEIEFTAVPVKWLELSGSAALTDPKYRVFTAPGLGDLSQNVFAQAPRQTYTASARLNLPLPETLGSAHLQASYYHQSKIYIGDLNQGSNYDPPLPGYGVLDLNADWRNVGGRPIDLAAFIKNVTNKDYLTGGVGVYASTGFQSATIGPPRTIGASVTVRFGAAARR